MPYTPDDPLYGQQWHFARLGMRGGVFGIEIIWDEYRGDGVTVVTYEPVNTTHPDLDAQFLDPPPIDSPDSGHGTPVAGLIAAEDNDIGGVGVAFRARLASEGVQKDFDVVNGSWGWGGVYPYTYAAFAYVNGDVSAYADMVVDGRAGLGTVMTKAAGNFSTMSASEVLDSSRFSISIAAISQSGFRAGYSSHGSAVLVGAPDAAVSTDPVGAPGAPGDYTFGFNGTSAASPVAAGVVALMLSANPDLGWRDVQDILAMSATRTGSTYGAGPANGEEFTWGFNAARTWNGGGHHVSADYGYGAVNVFNAVRLAEAAGYIGHAAQTSGNERSAASATVANRQPIAGTVAIPVGVSAGVMELDHVAVTLNITEADFTDLTITLISPFGTRILLHDGSPGSLNDGQPNDPSDDALTRFTTAASGQGGVTWTWGVDHLRGESPSGDWQIEVVDASPGNRNVQTVKIEVFGSYSNAHDVYVYTDELTEVVNATGEATRRIMNDPSGDNWVNGATLFGNLVLNMNPGTNSTLNGSTFISTSATNRLVGAIGADFSDIITGNALGNRIYGMRQDDQLFGGAGDDLINGGKGADDLDGGEGIDTVDYEGSDAAVIIDLSAPIVADRAKGGHAEGDFLIAGVPSGINTFENVSGSDHGDRLVGDFRVNVLWGVDGNDRLNGLDGADRMNGARGEDFLIGGLGADNVSGGEDDDLIFGDQPLFYIDSEIRNHFASGDETDNVSLQRALNLSGHFAITPDANVQDAATIPHVTISGEGADAVQYFSFFASAGESATFDIDGANFDSVIRLYDAAGVEIAANDDATLDPGSTNTTDSRFSYTFGSSELYTIAVRRFGTGTLQTPDDFQLHISLTNPSTTIEGGADTLFGDMGDDGIAGGVGADLIFGDQNLINPTPGAVTKTAGLGNSSLDRALNLDGTFSLTANGNIENAVTVDHVTVSGVGDGGVDYYAFNVTAASPALSTFDIDGATFDTSLRIYDARGNVLAEIDDNDLNGNTTPDPGSSGITDALLTYSFATPGVYYVAVSRYSSSERFGAITTGGAYTLHISLQDPSLTASGGRDTLLGGLGADTLDGGGGNDTLEGEADADLLKGGAGNDDLAGGEANDTLLGGLGNDTLDGGGGVDTLDGGAGDDMVLGGAGNDAMRATGGADVFDGGDGVDVVNFGPSTGASIFLDGSGTNGRAAVGDTFVGVENLVGSLTGGDWLVGASGANRFVGQGGDDRLWGRGGIDQLEGGAGADEMIGGAGADVLVGGADADRFVFDTKPLLASERDRITDFVSGTDRLQIDASAFGGGLTAGGGVSLIANALPSSAGQGPGGVFLYDTDTGFLSWDADGQNAGAAVLFVWLQGAPALSAGDFLVVA